MRAVSFAPAAASGSRRARGPRPAVGGSDLVRRGRRRWCGRRSRVTAYVGGRPAGIGASSSCCSPPARLVLLLLAWEPLLGRRRRRISIAAPPASPPRPRAGPFFALTRNGRRALAGPGPRAPRASPREGRRARPRATRSTPREPGNSSTTASRPSARERGEMSAPSDNSQETAAGRPSPRRSRLARRTPACANAPLCGNFESTVPSDFFARGVFPFRPRRALRTRSRCVSRSLLATRWRGRAAALRRVFWALNQPCWQGAMFLLTPAEGRLAGQKEANVPRETWRRRTHRRHARFLDARAEPPVATASTRRESGRRRSAAQARSGRIFRATHLSPGRRGSRDRRRFAGSRAR